MNEREMIGCPDHCLVKVDAPTHGDFREALNAAFPGRWTKPKYAAVSPHDWVEYARNPHFRIDGDDVKYFLDGVWVVEDASLPDSFVLFVFSDRVIRR